jgi:GNAT superfamily N-acetyltransferase
MELELVREIEHCALAAWPAEQEQALAGWRLRATRGVTRRANSAWTGKTEGSLPLEDRVDQVERFYAQRGLPSTIQLAGETAPNGLDALLARRGYRIDAPVSVQTADARRVTGERTSPSIATRIEPRVFDGWLALSARRGRFAAVEDVYRGLLERIGDGAMFCLAELAGQPAGVGLAVMSNGDWCGLFSMLTLPDHQRQGVARAIVGALARAAVARGAGSLYLQVERANLTAGALYARLGFTGRYEYHYRVGP